jgi:hypothetical protein
MNPIEYKVVRYEQGLLKRLTGDDFGDSFVEFLNAQGREGWDLKGVVRESGLDALLVFSRPVAQ